jgi:hypothetical protein
LTLASSLSEAIEVLDQRGADHGDYVELHRRIAQLWSAYLSVSIEPHQVAALMVLLKLARSELNPENNDNFVDLAGYAAIYAELRKIDRHTSPSEHEAAPPGSPGPTPSEWR